MKQVPKYLPHHIVWFGIGQNPIKYLVVNTSKRALFLFVNILNTIQDFKNLLCICSTKLLIGGSSQTLNSSSQSKFDEIFNISLTP